MPSRPTSALREAPATIPALGALALFVVWAGGQAGYPVTHWAPGGVLILALLALAALLVGVRPAQISTPTRVALGCLAAYTAFSFVSILWAGVPGDAWEGADRTLLYLLVFALFSCWRQRGTSAALLVSCWSLAMAALAAYVALHVDGASSARLATELPLGRLVYPTGYAPANAALWLIAAWPAFMLARGARLPWGLRGLLAAAAVLLAEVALLGQSRGSLYSTPVMLVLVFALAPRRVRTLATLVPVAGAIAATAPTLLRVGNQLREREVVPGHLHAAVTALFLAAAAAGLVVALGAAIERRLAVDERTARRVHRAAGAAGLAGLVVLVAGGLIAVGHPIARVRHAWDTFKSVRGYEANSSGSRLTSGLGSNRYDFYRVALDEFASHPLAGIGADNFQQQYLRHGRSEETPRYPHSVEIRTLAETGVVGALLALAGLAAALWGGARAVRPPPRHDRPDAIGGAARTEHRLGSDVAAAALAGFAYWLVHGSFDWFFEFAGLGAPAFALLGLACALAPQRAASTAATRATDEAAGGARGAAAPRRPLRARPLVALATVAALAAATSLVLPWLSQLEVQGAARIWPHAPRAAYARLGDAAGLNPLSDQAYLTSGSVALRFGDLARADHEFALALARVPDDAYATLERGAIASSDGRRALALALLQRAVRLNPRDSLTRGALRVAREGRRVDVAQLNRAIFERAGLL